MKLKPFSKHKTLKSHQKTPLRRISVAKPRQVHRLCSAGVKNRPSNTPNLSPIYKSARKTPFISSPSSLLPFSLTNHHFFSSVNHSTFHMSQLRPFNYASDNTDVTTTSFNLSKPQNYTIDAIRFFDDNYCYVMRDNDNNIIIVDPADPKIVSDTICNELSINLSDINIQKKTLILTTHHHYDHSGGNNYFYQHYPHLAGIYIGSYDAEKAQKSTKTINHNDVFSFGAFKFNAIHTPCHTRGSICYQFQIDDNNNNGNIEYGLFSGDTLFLGGCGRFFEGNAAEMYNNMKLFSKLPPSTRVYSGHEYTTSNLSFAHQVDPTNILLEQRLKWAQSYPRDTNIHPATIELEQLTNPFMKAQDEQQMAAIREMKNLNAPKALF